jgi:hypothetical protein
VVCTVELALDQPASHVRERFVGGLPVMRDSGVSSRTAWIGGVAACCAYGC